jgi:hypothetical protein
LFIDWVDEFGCDVILADVPLGSCGLTFLIRLFYQPTHHLINHGLNIIEGK